ncbi:MAG: hypothetical protein Q9P14_13445, partial [candidate division KSB1 bacterium]|nr:hypothetical protein [candidate division KSB1 bacterium]
MSKRRARRISVLLIPDDNVEPYSFQINLRTVRLLVFVGIILTIHMIVGGVAYWRWYREFT